MAVSSSSLLRGGMMVVLLLAIASLIAVGGYYVYVEDAPEKKSDHMRTPYFLPRMKLDPGGYDALSEVLTPWTPEATPEQISSLWSQAAPQRIAVLSKLLQTSDPSDKSTFPRRIEKVMLHNAQGETNQAYADLQKARRIAEDDPELAEEWLYTIIYFQGVTALRQGENENCILCRGESSCILPISPSAIHVNPAGSRRAIEHFTEYLKQFPDDLEVKWLLNLACMTLGEHPDKVDRQHRLSLERLHRSEFDVGKFRDVGALVGVNRFNQAGGAIFEDFNNNGLLDLFVTCWDPMTHAAFYRNKGDGTFEDVTKQAGLLNQLGGLYCVQADFDNDGFMDVFICRGAWLSFPMRPSLLRNNGDGTFTDVTQKSGLAHPVNSNSACWGDFDNDGHVDLFVCCETQTNRLYRNRGDGTFEEVAGRAGLSFTVEFCKGAAWLDFDNDGYLDLLINNLMGTARLYRNNRDGTFTEVTKEMGLVGPFDGFSCWAWDFDNDGWLDVFATSYDRSLSGVVQGLLGQPHDRLTSKLYRNVEGKRFKDVTHEAGLDGVYATMGSNFADFDNDGYLDFYLATGDPRIGMLVPNRMFKNVGGKRFAEITGTSGTGHLQKGHAVSCGDWNRNGSVDLFVQTGGAIDGDRFHNVLFQNPGQGNNWLNVKLVGKKTNRAAIGARIKVVTTGDNPQTVHRHVTSGSSFGANPLEQMIGLGKAEQIATLEIHWPTSGTTQTFHDLAANQAIEITEFAEDFKKRKYEPIALPSGG